jgi:hypothetical protein
MQKRHLEAVGKADKLCKCDNCHISVPYKFAVVCFVSSVFN